jgi:hypothetical protein
MKKKYDLAIICLTTITISLIVKIAFIMKFGPIKIGTQLISICLTLLLCYYLYQEKQWARWISIILFSFSGLIGIISTLTIKATLGSITLLIMGLFYLGSGAYLGLIRKWNT